MHASWISFLSHALSLYIAFKFPCCLLPGERRHTPYRRPLHLAPVALVAVASCQNLVAEETWPEAAFDLGET